MTARRVCGKPYMSAHVAYCLQSLEKICRDAVVVVIIPTTLVCFLFCTIIPTSLYNCFLYLLLSLFVSAPKCRDTVPEMYDRGTYVRRHEYHHQRITHVHEIQGHTSTKTDSEYGVSNKATVSPYAR